MDPGGMTSDALVRVCIRVRPLLPIERLEDDYLAVKTVDNQVKIASQAFTFNHVLGPTSKQEDIWPCVAPLIDSMFEGYNATIISYGQTGSGKTFTMGCSHSAFVSSPDEGGIIPRVVADVFSRIAAKAKGAQGYHTKVKLRFLEIYRDEVRDLLSLSGVTDTMPPPSLDENHNGQVYGVHETDVHSAGECIELLDKGAYFRTTSLHSESSRSHAVLTLTMEQYTPTNSSLLKIEEEGAAVEYDVRSSYFSLVDLAGSGAQHKTSPVDQQVDEAFEMTKGVCELRGVITALGGDGKRGHQVPSRDSALTSMLQDALGGNSMTLMVFCVSPADKDVAETKSSLTLANRARYIQNNPVRNRVVSIIDEVGRRAVAGGQNTFNQHCENLLDARSHKNRVHGGFPEVDLVQERLRAIEDLHDQMHQAKLKRDKMLDGSVVKSASNTFEEAMQEQQNDEETKLDDELLMLIKAMETNSINTLQPLSTRSWIAVPSSDSEDDLQASADEEGLINDNADCNDSLGLNDPVDALNPSDEDLTRFQVESLHSDQAFGSTVQSLTLASSHMKRMLQTLRRNTKKYEQMHGLFEAVARAMDENERLLADERKRLREELDKIQHQSSDPRHSQLSSDLQAKDNELEELRKKQEAVKRFEEIKTKSDILLAKYRQ